MDVMTSRKADMEQLLQSLRTSFPDLRFVAGKSFYWSPATQEIFYIASNKPSDLWSLLHETGHAALEHTKYSFDFELLEMELAAWQKAKELGTICDITIDQDHIENCLDSYRDWLHRRSICPNCTTQALQTDTDALYRCFNCQATWRVTSSRFCRPYRQQHAQKESPAIFAVADDSVRL